MLTVTGTESPGKRHNCTFLLIKVDQVICCAWHVVKKWSKYNQDLEAAALWLELRHEGEIEVVGGCCCAKVVWERTAEAGKTVVQARGQVSISVKPRLWFYLYWSIVQKKLRPRPPYSLLACLLVFLALSATTRKDLLCPTRCESYRPQSSGLHYLFCKPKGSYWFLFLFHGC